MSFTTTFLIEDDNMEIIQNVHVAVNGYILMILTWKLIKRMGQFPLNATNVVLYFI